MFHRRADLAFCPRALFFTPFGLHFRGSRFAGLLQGWLFARISVSGSTGKPADLGSQPG
jgi:hypothetical protein